MHTVLGGEQLLIVQTVIRNGIIQIDDFPTVITLCFLKNKDTALVFVDKHVVGWICRDVGTNLAEPCRIAQRADSVFLVADAAGDTLAMTAAEGLCDGFIACQLHMFSRAGPDDVVR
ncbi:Uncharacterised protein [uncultured Ruminococcus sp.]|nr:Uncharacterised protein [uncultured Ruminococcus sp.]